MNFRLYSIGLTLLSFFFSFCSNPNSDREKPVSKNEIIDSTQIKPASVKAVQPIQETVETVDVAIEEVEDSILVTTETPLPTPSVIQEQLFAIEKARIKLSSRQNELLKINYTYSGPFTETSQTWFFDESYALIFYQAKSGLEGKTDESTFISLTHGKISSFSRKMNDAKREEVITWDAQTSEKAVKIVHDWENDSEYLEYVDFDFDVVDFKKHLPSKSEFSFDSQYVYARTNESPVEGKDPVRTMITIDSLIFEHVIQ